MELRLCGRFGQLANPAVPGMMPPLCRPPGRTGRRRGRSSGVEHNLAKVGVEGSNPFARSSISNHPHSSLEAGGRLRRASEDLAHAPQTVARRACRGSPPIHLRGARIPG